jgi:hypothetical protein
MSEGEVEVESPSGYQVLPKEVTEEIGSIKLFNKWSYEDVEIRDISLTYDASNYPTTPQFHGKNTMEGDVVWAKCYMGSLG